MPSITIWNRVEPRARTQDLKPGLEARVHDPLWLLARQWQLGEFAGRDAGSPVAVDVASTAVAFDRYAAGNEAARPYDNRVPLEALIEREPVHPVQATGDLRQAVAAGIGFFRLLDRAKLSHLRPAYLSQYALPTPAGLDADGQRLSAVVSRRVIDGVKLRSDLAHAGNALPPQPAITPADHDAVLKVAKDFLRWYDSLFSEPVNKDVWSPDRMEYSFAVAAGATGSLSAREYDGGSIDWHTFDRSPTKLAGSAPAPVTASRRMLAAPVSFRGMPARRFWELEDASVDIGALTAGAEDIGRLLLRDFALIYGNEWFQIPLAVPVGCEVTINSLSVSDTFGVATPIPHYTDIDGPAGAWRMFSVSTGVPVTEAASARILVIAPNAVSSIDSSAIEDVLLLRDEVANMAWGVESAAVGPSGLVIDRALAYRTGIPAAAVVATRDIPAYRLGSTMPDYWIPFLPVVVSAAGPLRIRRGRVPAPSSAPIGRLLGYPGLTMFVEELPREGVHLERLYRYARGPDGSTHVWIGRRRSTGRGEGRSGLQFDYLEH